MIMSDKEKKDKKKADKTEETQPRVGVYVCHCGGNISDVVDTSKVSKIIGEDPNVAVSKDFIFMCSDPGQKMIADDVKANHLDHVIVASCSPRLHEMTFQRVVSDAGLNPFQYQHVNIREQVSWVHSHQHEEATDKSIRLIRGAIASVLDQPPLEPIKKKMIQSAAVIGGGVAGMTAALDLANRDIPVHLIEKGPVLGGNLLNLDKLYPMEIDAKSFALNLADKVLKNPAIYLHLDTVVDKTEGAIGDFMLQLKKTEESTVNKENFAVSLTEPEKNPDYDISVLHVGSFIMATGHDLYEPYEGEYGYKKSPFVVTLPDLIKYLNIYRGNTFVYKGKEIKTVAMIHCVGSRQIEGVHQPPPSGILNTNCSRVCCTTTLQQANRLKSLFPKIQIYDLYRDIRTYGEKEHYYEEASKNNVIFIKYPDEESPEVEINGSLKIKTRDIITYGLEVEMEVDMIVLAVGLIPRIKPHIITDLSLPTGNNGFLQEAHVKLRPVESSVQGVFLAGTAQGPKDVRESTTTASAAAAKAGAILTKESINLSPFVAVVDTDKCQGHALCVNECEYNAITIHDKGVGESGVKIASVDPSACVGCGACVAVCPEQAIQVQGYDINKLEKEISAIMLEVKQ